MTDNNPPVTQAEWKEFYRNYDQNGEDAGDILGILDANGKPTAPFLNAIPTGTTTDDRDCQLSIKPMTFDPAFFKADDHIEAELLEPVSEDVIEWKTRTRRKELARDVEYGSLDNHAECIPDDPINGGATWTAGVPAILKTNAFGAEDGRGPETGLPRIPGTPRMLTEPMLQSLLNSVPSADFLLIKSTQKKTYEFLAGDTYFHRGREIPLISDRSMPDGQLLAINQDSWLLSWFLRPRIIRHGRKYVRPGLSRSVVCSYKLECHNEALNGGIFDLITS